MADVALTTIQHGTDDGKVITVREGDEVNVLPKEVVAELKKQGAVGSPAVGPARTDEQTDALKARVAELESQLAEAQKQSEENPTPPAPPATPQAK